MANKLNPFGLHNITPYLIVRDAESLMEFIEETFDTRTRGAARYNEKGKIQHAEIVLGDSVIMVGELDHKQKKMNCALYVYVDNCDKVMEKAIKNGAKQLSKPKTYPHGDRYGAIEDPSGNMWLVVTHVGA